MLGKKLSIPALALAAVLVTGERPAQACGWDWETYHAEAKSLPCVFDALLGYWPKHTEQYHRTRIAAADQALRWVPGWTEGLDAKGISLMKLGRMDEAKEVMERRHALSPDAYPGHANLGTLYTFTADYDAALRHIDAAMAIEPEAHFGREKYHRALVVFLKRVADDPEVATTENFLGIELSSHQRQNGSRAVFRSLSLDEDAFDALVSMLTVYGADEVAEIYLTLGEVLAARGHRRLAYSAYRRAKELGHVRRKELQRWMSQMYDGIKAEHVAEHGPSSGSPFRRDGYLGIDAKYNQMRRKAKAFQKRWAEWETKRLAKGLPIWTQAGLDEIYARMNDQRDRCDAPRIIDDARAPMAEADGTAPPRDEGDGDEG